MPYVMDLMTLGVLTLPPNTTVSRAAAYMAEHGVGSIIVTEGDKVVGVVTERDFLTRVLAKGLDPSKTTLEEIMSRDVITVKPYVDLVEALKLMKKHRVRRLPVVQNGRLVGLITERQIVSAIITGKERSEEARLLDELRAYLT